MRQAIEMLLSYCIKRRLRQVSRSKLETTEQQNPNSTIELQDDNPMRGQIDRAEGSKESNEATRGHTSGAQINCYKGSKLTDKSSQRFFGLARVREPRDESNSCAKRRKLKAQQAKILSTNDDRRQTMMKSKRSNANFHLAVLLAIIIFELLINVLPESRLELSVSDKTRPPSTLINYLFRNSHFASMLTSSGLPSIKLAEAQSYKPEWPNAQLQQEIFLLNLEDGYFGCQVNESQDYLQLFELSRLCDGQPQCYLGSDELSSKLKCNRRDKCSQIVNLRGQSEYMPCVNGVCLDGLCYCNDGFGGKSCDVPDENECKFRPCDVFAHCTNTMGSYYCSCFPGYDGDGIHCQDINECEIPSLAALCSDNSECCNLPGHFICKCKPGYQQSSSANQNGAPAGANNSVSCTDIDECLDERACGRGATCENLPGSFRCLCPAGFTGDPSVECIDMDECRNDPCGSGAQCTNMPGGYRCSCAAGFERNPAYPANLLGTHITSSLASTTLGSSPTVDNLQQQATNSNTDFSSLSLSSNTSALVACLDINECALASQNGKPICGLNAQCINTPGGFFCQCPPNFTGNPKVSCTDIDECQSQACGPNAQCNNTPGSYKCDCKPGFTGNAYSTDGCQDEDECQRKDACGLNAQCFNSMGSYECFCKSGFTGDPYTKCMDIDECLTSNPCGPGAKCTNTPGSFKCNCPDKHLARGTPEMGCERVAVDINCSGDSDCTQNAFCFNTTCQCKLGYQTKGIECVDVDECSLSQPIQTVPLIQSPKPFTKLGRASALFNQNNNNNSNTAICGIEANCVNIDGSFRCECKPGYERHNPASQTSKCRDINECELPGGTCGPNSKCFNTDGSFRCTCDDGFIPVDGDQTKGCKSPCEDVNCGQHATCRPHGEEAACVCKPGFTYDPNNIKLGCVDINECDTNYGPAGLCGQRATCTNVPGSYRCKCPSGFTGDPHRYCEDINECDRRFGVFGQCGEMAICNNTLGSFTCSCGPGFTGDPRTKCVDVDECSTRFGPNGKCGQDAICTNTPGKFACRCPPGYSGDPNIRCVPDRPSCSSAADCLGANQICQSGRCQCPFPQSSNGDQPSNECQHPCDKTECGSQATCQLDSESQPICVCNAGYIAPSDGRSGCIDVNECIQGFALSGITPISTLNGNPRASVAMAGPHNSSHPCGRNALCRNQPGTFDCVCPPGYSGNAYEACVLDVRNQQGPSSSVFGNYQQEPRTSSCSEPCPRGQICLDGQCVKSGSELTLCRADGDCRPDQACEYLQQSSLTSSFQCVHVCELHRCGPNARCHGSNHKPICSCIPSHSGDPYDRLTGCQMHIPNDSSTTAAGYLGNQTGTTGSTRPSSFSSEADDQSGANETPATAFEFGPIPVTSMSPGGIQRNSNNSQVVYEMQAPTKRPNQSVIAYELPLPTTPILPNLNLDNNNNNKSNQYQPSQHTNGPDQQLIQANQNQQVGLPRRKQPQSSMISSTPSSQQSTSMMAGLVDSPNMNYQQPKRPSQSVNERFGTHPDNQNSHEYQQFQQGNKSNPMVSNNFVFEPTTNLVSQQSQYQLTSCSGDQHCPGNLQCLPATDQLFPSTFPLKSSQKYCGCPVGYKREADYCYMHRVSCNSTSWCKAREECLSSLAGSQGIEFTGICICPRGYQLTASGQLCVDRDECTEGTPCALGAICQNKIGSYECVCPPGTVGDPYSKTCEPTVRPQLPQQLIPQHQMECRSNSDCSNDRECDLKTHKCISPCHVCGPRAFCTAANHAAICLCPPRFIGNAIDPIFGCHEPPATTTSTSPSAGLGASVTTTTQGSPYSAGVTTQTPPSASVPTSGRNGQGSSAVGVPVTTLLPSTTTTTTLAPQTDENSMTLLPTTTPESVEFRTIPPSELFVMCLADGIQVELQLGGFDGIIYVKGHSQDPKCRKLVMSSNPNEFVDFKVQFGHCDLIHRGGEASFVLVIQKHPKLVTYRARAYHVKCVYNTGERTVTLGFNVSMITTSGTIANTGPPPTCLMSITALDGREVSSAEIGQDLLLRVDVQPDSIYGGFARSCEAKTMDDEGEYQYEVTDANGCATDPSIFSDWKYDQHRKSLVARFNAFKFPSSNNLRFQCNIRVCFGSCPPVNCNGIDSYGRRRKRREAGAIDFISDNSTQPEEDVDPTPDQLVVSDAFKEGALREEIQVQSNAILTFDKKESSSLAQLRPQIVEDIEFICLPRLGITMSILVTILMILLGLAIATSCWCFTKRRKSSRQATSSGHRQYQGPLMHPVNFPNPLNIRPKSMALSSSNSPIYGP